MAISIRGMGLTIEEIFRVAEGEGVQIAEDQLPKIARAHAQVQRWGQEKEPIYGVNTGFGELIRVVIPPQLGSELQLNLVRSHAAGGGPAFPDRVVRAIMVTRLNSLVKGHSGLSVAGVKQIEAMLNLGVHPVIYSQGSLGASGDLAPLAHLALGVIGEGACTYQGVRRPTADVFAQLGLKPLVPGFKEALAMINGTSAMTGLASLNLMLARHLLRLGILLSADAIQCLNASSRPFEHDGNAIKNHAGQTEVARLLRDLLSGSQLTREHQQIMEAMKSHLEGDDPVDTGIFLQNAYSLRCIPQILGPVSDTLTFCQRFVEEEANSVNDNPVLFDRADTCFHGGNFHGQYVAMASDYLNVATAEIGVLAERQLNRLVDPALCNNLPQFLAYKDTGLFCGFEGAQYLATSVASENLDLAVPASIKSIPSNGSNQDVVSMGLNAARRSAQLLENVATILAVGIAACRQAAHFVGEDRFSPALQDFHRACPVLASPYKDDSPMNEILAQTRAWLLEPATVQQVARLVS